MTEQIETQTNSQVIQYQVNNEDVKLSPKIVKAYLVKGNSQKISDSEIVMFMQLCRFQHLNPFLNEAYLIKYGDQPASIITSKEAFMKRAENNKHYKGSRAGIVVARGDDMKYLNGALKMPKDQLIGAWAEVERDDREKPIHVEIAFEEFAKTKLNYKTHKREYQSTWKEMPANMIRKTALVNALREAFPENLGSLYTEDDRQPANVDEAAKATEDEPKTEKTVASELLNEPAKETENEPDKRVPEKNAETVSENTDDDADKNETENNDQENVKEAENNDNNNESNQQDLFTNLDEIESK